MAIKISCGDVKRGDLFFVDPMEVVVKEELRGRSRLPEDDVVVDMAESMMTYGQRQAVEARRIDGNRLLLTMGFTRTAAARLIRLGYVNGAGEEVCDPEFLLKITITDANDKQAFMHNVVENAHRNQTTPIDDATNQQKLRDQWGYSDADISRVYRCAASKISRYRKLLSLKASIQERIHSGDMSVNAALDLCDMPEEQQETVVAEAVATNGKVDGASVRRAARNHNLSSIVNDDNKPASTTASDPVPTGGAKPRSMKELRDFLASLDGPGTDVKLVKVVRVFKAWMAGMKTDKQLTNAFDTLCPKVEVKAE